MNVWRDNKLAGNDEFSEEILAQLPDVAMLISVLSPRYLKSDWCKREANEFCRLAEAGVGINISRKSRIFKVLKLPVESLEGLPAQFKTLRGFRFYKSKDDVALELDAAYGPDMVADFNAQVAILAQNLADTVVALQLANKPDQIPVQTKGAVFLAETSWDREPERRLLEAELSSRNYLVLPDQGLPSHEDACRTEVKKILSQCEIAVHILGSEPGMVPNGPSQRSLDELQNEMAAGESASRGIPRIIWIQDGHSKSPAHQQFLDRLSRHDQNQLGADVVTGDFELLKSAVLSSLQKLQKQKESPAPEISSSDPGGEKLYFICDKRDAKDTLELRRALSARGFDPQRNLFEGTAGAVRQHNDKMLQQCGTVVLYYGAGEKAWYRSIRIELEKSRTEAAVWTYLAAPITSHKQELFDELEGGLIIDGLSGELPESALSRILPSAQQHKSAGGASP